MRVTRVAAVKWVRMKVTADWGAVPAKVSMEMRPMGTRCCLSAGSSTIPATNQCRHANQDD